MLFVVCSGLVCRSVTAFLLTCCAVQRSQTSLTEHMFSILIDWLVDVAVEFYLGASSPVLRTCLFSPLILNPLTV